MGTDPVFGRRAASHLAVRPFRTAIRALTVALIAALALFGGTAYAYFAGSGTGSGRAALGKVGTVTLVAVVTTTPNSSLSPGHSADVLLKVKNPNPHAATLVKVTWTGGPITADAGHPSCTTTGVSFVNWTGVISIPPDTATNGYPEGYPVHLTGHATMSDASSNGCQGATFFIPVTITVKVP
jgi:hypothetical protein